MIVSIQKSGAVTARAETLDDVKVLLAHKKQKRVYKKRKAS